MNTQKVLVEHKNSQSNTFFKSIYFTIALFVAIATIITCSTLYRGFKIIGTEILMNQSQEYLRQISTTAKTVVETGNQIVLEIFQDKDITPILFSNNAKANQVSVALDRLDTYRLSSQYIHSIYVYNKEKDEIYTTLPSEGLNSKQTFFDEGIIEIINNKDNRYTIQPLPRKIRNRLNLSANEHFVDVYTFMCYERDKENTITNAVIVNISQEWLEELIQELSKELEEDIFIIDKYGVLMSANTKDEMLTDISKTEYITKILESQSPNGYLVQKIENKQSLITYVSLPDLHDWKFIKVTDYNELITPLKLIRNNMILIMISICAIGSILAFIISKKIYKLILNLEKNFDILKKEMLTSKSQLKYSMLEDFIKGGKGYTKKELEAYIKKYDINLDTNMSSKIVIITLDNYGNSAEEFESTNQQLIKFSIKNIYDELCGKEFNCSMIDISDNVVVGILNFKDYISEEVAEQIISNNTVRLQTLVKELFQESISITISELIEDISIIHEIYNETSKATRYKMFYGKGCIIYSKIIHQIEEKKYVYLEQQHNLLFMNLKAGKLEEVKKIYLYIMNRAAEYSYMSYISTALNIGNHINLVIDELSNKIGELMIMSQFDITNEVSRVEYTNEIDELFFEIFENICITINKSNLSKKDKEYQSLIKNVYSLIENRYDDIDICIQNIADSFDMSAPYLGRTFKKYTGRTITECINERRIKKASELLIHTNKGIADISDECGFSNITYFYKIFKDIHGVPPNVYRNSR